MVNIITKTSNTPGNTTVILAGVHGNETCGIKAFEKIIPDLEIKKGTVHFIYGNPKAIKENVRYIDVNLNRMFREDSEISSNDKTSYEYKRSREIMPYLNEADALLDIHASNTPESTPFIICERKAEKIAQALNIEIIVSGFDELEPGGTDGYMNKQGKIGICLECGYLGDSQSIEIAIENIYRFLIVQGHIDGKLITKKQTQFNMNYIYHTQTDMFTLVKEFSDFEKVTKNQIIGTDGEYNITAPNYGVIMFARNRNKKGEEAFLLGIKKID